MDESIITMQFKGQREYNAVLVSLGILHEHLDNPGVAVVVDKDRLAERLSFGTDSPITADEIQGMVERVAALDHLCKYCGNEFDGSFGFDLCPDCSKNQESKNQ